MVLVAMNPVHAAGSLSRRRVCPVGAVSKMMWSNPAVARRIAQQLRELVERGDLDGARAGQLLFHAVDGGLGQHAAIGSDDAFPVSFCGGFRIDVQREQAVRAGNGGRLARQAHAEDLVEIRCRVGADQQHPLALAAPGLRRGAGQRGLADAALAGEEQNAGGALQEFQQFVFQGRLRSSAVLITGNFTPVALSSWPDPVRRRPGAPILPGSGSNPC